MKAIELLKENDEKAFLVYVLILFSGVGFEYVVRVLNNYSPDEVVYLRCLDSDIRRLTCFEGKEFCRYYLRLEESRKPEAFMYFSSWLLKIVEKCRNQIPRRDTITKYAKEKDIMRPKYVRVFAIRQI